MAVDNMSRMIFIDDSRHQTRRFLSRNLAQQLTVIFCFVRHQLCDVWICERVVLLFLVNIDVVEANEIEEMDAIDHAKAEELADAWFGGAVLQLGQPAVGNAESPVALGVGNSPACALNFAARDVASVAKRFQLLTSRQSIPPLSVSSLKIGFT